MIKNTFGIEPPDVLNAARILEWVESTLDTEAILIGRVNQTLKSLIRNVCIRHEHNQINTVAFDAQYELLEEPFRINKLDESMKILVIADSFSQSYHSSSTKSVLHALREINYEEDDIPYPYVDPIRGGRADTEK